jgi:large subunit ribosomal protein L24
MAETKVVAKKIKLKKGDLVQVISGKDKGKQGKITTVDTKTGCVFVEGVNQVKRHVKPSQTNPQGGITLKTSPLHACKVMIVDPKTGKPTRIGMKKVETKDKKTGKTKTQLVRVAKKSGQELTTVKGK